MKLFLESTLLNNKHLAKLGEQLQLKFTSHSFRKGLIKKLWRDTGDIFFVSAVIGHFKIETTARYIGRLSTEEIAKPMEKLD